MAGNSPIFEYRFLPYSQPFKRNAMDGGFCVSVWDNGSIVFKELNSNEMIRRQMVFPIAPESLRSIRNVLTLNGYWTRSLMRHRLQRFQAPYARYYTHLYLENIDDYLEMEDITQLMNSAFRTYNGHYSRLLYTMLEDFSSVLYRSGFTFTLDGFVWDPAYIRPAECSAEDRNYTGRVSLLSGT